MIETRWTTLVIGGGGFCTGMSFSTDGKTKIVRNDGGQAYLLNGTGDGWISLTTTDSLPSGYRAGSVYDAAVAPGNANIIYMMHEGHLFESADQGKTFRVLPAFAQVPPMTVNANGGPPRLNGRKMAVSFFSPSVMIVGTGVHGCFITRNGGQSFARLSAIPQSLPAVFSLEVATSAPTAGTNVLRFLSTSGILKGDYVVNASNPKSIPPGTTVAGVTTTSVTLSAHVTVAAGHKIGFVNPNNATSQCSGYAIEWNPVHQQTCYVASWGSPIYKSTDAGLHWYPLNAGSHPTTAQCLRVGPDMTLWVVSQNSDYSGTMNNVWSCSEDGCWTHYTKRQIGQVNAARCIAPNVHDTAPHIRVAVIGWGLPSFAMSVDNFKTTNGNYPAPTLDYDATWLETLARPTPGWLEWDTAAPNTIWLASGWAPLKCDPPTAHAPIAWHGIANGIENLTPSQVLSAPGCDRVFVTNWDVGLFRRDPSVNVLATTEDRITQAHFCAGWGVDYASSDPSFLCAVCNWGSTQESVFSTDGGVTWTPFATQLPGYGGCIAAATPKNIIWLPSGTGNAGIPQTTDDGGVTWRTPLGVPTEGRGYLGPYWVQRPIVCADRDAVGTFYLRYYLKGDPLSGVWRSTDGGNSFNQVFAGPFPILPNVTSNGRLTSIPGAGPGHVLWAEQGANSQKSALLISDDGGATWRDTNPDMRVVIDYGLGASAPGESGATLFVIGTLAGVPGIYRSADLGANYDLVSDMYPAGTIAALRTISGDANVYGRCYVSLSGQGWLFGEPL